MRWVSETVKKLRGMASNAQADLQREIGPELDELRRQIADIKATQEFQDLKSLRNVNPRHFIQKNVLGDGLGSDRVPRAHRQRHRRPAGQRRGERHRCRRDRCRGRRRGRSGGGGDQ